MAALKLTPQLSITITDKLTSAELTELCQATESAIEDGIGFNWLKAPALDVLESYWRGVSLVPERTLFLGKLDGVTAGSLQLVRPGASKESTAFAVTIENHFVAPWARGHNIARELLHKAEETARESGFTTIRLAVRGTQEAAIQLYESEGYERWGILPRFELVQDDYVTGHHFWKDISSDTP